MGMFRTKTLKDKLRELREAGGFTQEAIAEELNINRSTYTCYEIGKTKPSLEVLNSLAKLFNVSVEDFLEDDPTELMFSDSNSRFSDVSRVPNNSAALTDTEKQLILKFRLATAKDQRKAFNALNNLDNKKIINQINVIDSNSLPL